MRAEARSVDGGGRSSDVNAAVANLPCAERRVISLALFEGLTYREVAQRLELAEATVKSQIRSALTSLARTLDVRADTGSVPSTDA